MHVREFIVAALVGLALPATACAQTGPYAADFKLVSATAELADGEIRKVDKDARKLTIRHGPIQNLDMPPMTMVFQVKNPGMLDQVKAGDKVKFSVENSGGAYVVTHIEPAK